MIARLRGRPVANTPEGLVLDVGGVGYLVATTPSAVRNADGVDEVALHTYLHVREDALQLYGFAEAAERELFPDDVREARLPQARWPDKEDVVERLVATLRRVEHDRKLFLDPLLPDELGQTARAQRLLEVVLFGHDGWNEELGRHQCPFQ